MGDAYYRARGNYVVTWGNQSVPYNANDPLEDPKLGVAVFGYDDNVNSSKPRKTTLSGISDGTSNTLLMSEIVMSGADSDFDIRGDFLNDDRPCTQFMTSMVPNSPAPVIDRIPYCKDQPTLPCTTAGSANARKAARSKHTGGVNTLFGDGSIRFIQNAISPTTWRAMGTMNGGEVISDN